MIIKEPPKPRDGISSVARLIRYMETAQKSKGQEKDEERVLYSGAINMACNEMTAEMRPARIAEMYFLSKKNRMKKRMFITCKTVQIFSMVYIFKVHSKIT